MSQDVSMVLGDYLEALIELGGTPENSVRPIDLAKLLSVSKPSVCSAVSTLKRKGLAEQPYRGGITLTAEGYEIGLSIQQRHKVAEAFLSDVLKLDESQVDAESRIMKYAIGDESFATWENFVTEWKVGA